MKFSRFFLKIMAARVIYLFIFRTAAARSPWIPESLQKLFEMHFGCWLRNQSMSVCYLMAKVVFNLDNLDYRREDEDIYYLRIKIGDPYT